MRIKHRENKDRRGQTEQPWSRLQLRTPQTLNPLRRHLQSPKRCFFYICCPSLSDTMLLSRPKVIRKDGNIDSFLPSPAFARDLNTKGKLLVMSLRFRVTYWFLERYTEVLSHVWLFHDPIACTPPGSSVHGIFQVRLLEWISISYSRGSSWPRDRPPCLLCFPRWQVDTLPLAPLEKPS